MGAQPQLTSCPSQSSRCMCCTPVGEVKPDGSHLHQHQPEHRLRTKTSRCLHWHVQTHSSAASPLQPRQDIHLVLMKWLYFTLRNLLLLLSLFRNNAAAHLIGFFFFSWPFPTWQQRCSPGFAKHFQTCVCSNSVTHPKAAWVIWEKSHWEPRGHETRLGHSSAKATSWPRWGCPLWGCPQPLGTRQHPVVQDEPTHRSPPALLPAKKENKKTHLHHSPGYK